MMTRSSGFHALAVLPLLFAGCAETPPDMMDVALAAEGAGNPTVAVDDRTGAAYAAWIATAGTAGDVYVSRIDSAGRGSAVRVNDVAGDAAPHDQAPPQVAVGPDGAVYVVWQNNTVVPGRRFPASNLRFARSVDGGRTFSPAVYVNDDAAGPPASHTFQDIAIARDGTIHVSWIDGRTRALAESAGHAADADGHGHAGAMPGSEIRVARSVDGGRTFSSGVVVHTDACPCCRTSLAVSGDTVAVAFRSATDNVRDVLVARSVDGGSTFAPPIRVHADGWVLDGCPHAGASLALDAAGGMHVAWYTGAEERQGLWYATARAGSTSFGSPIPLQAGGWVPVSQVKLSIDHAGMVWIAWDDRRADEARISVARVRDGDVLVIPDDVRGTSPAIDAAANVVVGWQDGAAASARVYRR